LKSYKREAEGKGMVMDLTRGKGIRSMVDMTNYKVILSSVDSDTLTDRVNRAWNRWRKQRGISEQF